MLHDFHSCSAGNASITSTGRNGVPATLPVAPAVMLLVAGSLQEKAASGCARFTGGGDANGGEVIDRTFVLAQTASDA